MRYIKFLIDQFGTEFSNKQAMITVFLIVLIPVTLFIFQLQLMTGTAQPDRFTELYFENHNNLPTKLAYPGQYTWYKNPTSNLYSFRFTIHNLENKDMNYTYEIFTVEKGKSVVDKGTVFVKNGQSKTIAENFTYPVYHDRAEVVVSLPEKNQAISFWIEKAVNENK